MLSTVIGELKINYHCRSCRGQKPYTKDEPVEARTDNGRLNFFVLTFAEPIRWAKV